MEFHLHLDFITENEKVPFTQSSVGEIWSRDVFSAECICPVLQTPNNHRDNHLHGQAMLAEQSRKAWGLTSSVGCISAPVMA